MSLGTKLAVIAGVLLIAAASGWRFLTQAPVGDPLLYPELESTASLFGSARAPAARDRAADRAGFEESDVPEFFAPPPAEPAPVAGAWQLRGRVEGLAEGHPPSGVTAAVAAPRRLDPEKVSLWELRRSELPPPGAFLLLASRSSAVNADGTFLVDVQDLLAEHPSARELHLSVEDPWYLPVSVHLPREELERGEDPADVVLAVSHCGALSGTLRDERGPVAGALVGVFALVEGVPDETPRELTSSDGQGRFRLRSDVEGDCLVVAVAPRLLPAARTAWVRRGEELGVAPLVLLTGEVISGRVTHAETGQGLAGAPLRLRREAAGTTLQVAGNVLVLEGGAVARAEATVFADDAGRYQFSGLPPGTHRVDLLASPSLADHSQSVSALVQAPARGVDFTTSGALLVVEAWCAGQPLDAAEVVLRDTRGGREDATTRAGVAHLLVPAERVYQVSLSADAMSPVVLPGALLRGGTLTRRTLHVEPQGATSTLVVELLPEGPGRVDRALFTFDAGQGALERVGVAEAGRFVLPDLAPGAYRLSIQPLAASDPDQLAPLFPALETTVELGVNEVVERSFSLSGGGRLRIAARDAGGACVEARCTVQDESGQKLDARFSAAGEAGWTMTRPEVLFDRPSTVQSVLPPGDYEIHLAARGYGLKTVRARVEAGQTTEIDAVLERE